LAVVLSGASIWATVAVAAAQQAPVPATVLNVVDGDTVEVQLEDGRTERVRLIGIDTPEIVDPAQPVQCFGAEASARAHVLLDGQSVALELDATQGERDFFGRLLAYVWLPDSRNFGETMLADGFAHEYTYSQAYMYVDAFKAAQDTAMANQAGLWSPSTCSGDTTRPADPPAEVAAPPAAVAAPAAPVAAPKPAAPAYAGRYDPFGPDRDCNDFRSQAEAQAFFIAAGGPKSDRHRLDADHDGIACEALR
jgi:micrococcal nuclease